MRNDLIKHLETEELAARLDLRVRLAAAERHLAKAKLELRREIRARKAMETRMRKANELLKETAIRCTQAREDERARISHELHEGVAQTLSGLRLQLAMLPHHFGSRLRTPSRRMNVLVADAIRRIRGIVSTLRPPVLDTNLGSGLSWLVQQFIQRTGTRCALMLPPGDLIFGDRCTTALFRIAEESLANVALHAHASHVEVALTLHKDSVQLRVSDNGCGFDPHAVNEEAFGVIAMKEQARAAGGECRISTVVHGGTTVVARIPPTGALTERPD